MVFIYLLYLFNLANFKGTNTENGIKETMPYLRIDTGIDVGIIYFHSLKFKI